MLSIADYSFSILYFLFYHRIIRVYQRPTCRLTRISSNQAERPNRRTFSVGEYRSFELNEVHRYMIASPGPIAGSNPIALHHQQCVSFAAVWESDRTQSRYAMSVFRSCLGADDLIWRLRGPRERDLTNNVHS